MKKNPKMYFWTVGKQIRAASYPPKKKKNQVKQIYYRAKRNFLTAFTFVDKCLLESSNLWSTSLAISNAYKKIKKIMIWILLNKQRYMVHSVLQNIMGYHHEKGLAPSKKISFSTSFTHWQTRLQVFIANACKQPIPIKVDKMHLQMNINQL